MNRLKIYLLFLAVFSAVAFFPLKVHAQFMPPMLPSSGADTAVTAMTNLMLKEIVNSLGIDMPENDYKNAWRLMTGQTYDDSFNFVYLDGAGLESSSLLTLYDSSGNVVPWSNVTVAFGSNSQGMTTTFIYDNSTGDILNIGESFQTSETSLDGRVNDLYVNFCEDIVSPMRQQNQTAIYKPTELSSELKNYVESQPFSLYAMSRDHSYCVVVPNACSSDCTVMASSSIYSMNFSDFSGTQGRTMPTILANDESFVYWLGTDSWQGFNSGTYSYYGHTFTLRSKIHNIANPLWEGGALYYHIPTQQEFNNVVNGFGNEMEQKVIFANIIQPFSVPNTMNYDKLRTQQITKNITVNNDYDYSQPMTVNNYPVNVIYPNPDVAPIYNTYETIYNYYTQPQIKDETEVNPEDIGNGVPILSNLQNRFPFSIPWDIANIFKGLEAEREAPLISGDIILPVINYTWHVELDLSMYDSSAELLRKCILILFIVGLAVFSYSHHFGS